VAEKGEPQSGSGFKRFKGWLRPVQAQILKKGRGSAAGCAEKLHNLPPMTHSAEKLLSGKR
jgi:hypothetical protein